MTGTQKDRRHRLSRAVATGMLMAALLGCRQIAQADTPNHAAPILDFIRIAPTGLPRATLPAVTAKVVPLATSKPTAAPRASTSLGTKSLAGNATWYAYVVGGAAAGPALRNALGSHWRYKKVMVCAGRCVVVTLSDWCLCSHGNRLIDLDSRSFEVLAPLSQGTVRVTVSW